MHGGNDTGTQNKKHKLEEKVFALDVAQGLERLVAVERWRVLMTRTEDRFVGARKQQRTSFGKRAAGHGAPLTRLARRSKRPHHDA